MKVSKGFTLIEVIVVMVVVGIMAAIAIPGYLNWLPNYRLTGAASDLFSHMQKTKLEAVKRNANCAITFNQSVNGMANVCITYVDADADCEYDAGEVIIDRLRQWPKQVSLDLTEGDGDGLSFTNNDDGKPTISFRPNAIPTANGGGLANGTVFLVNTNGKKKDVIINRAGNIRIE